MRTLELRWEWFPHTHVCVLGVLQIVPMVTALVGSSYRYHRGEVGSWGPVLVMEPVAHLPGRAAHVPRWAVARGWCGHESLAMSLAVGRVGLHGVRLVGGWAGAAVPNPLPLCLCRMRSTALW